MSKVGKALLGLPFGLIGLKIAMSGSANDDLRDAAKTDPTYTANPEAAKRLALAQTLLNARMPGSVSAERNIYSSAANQNAGIDRNATDANQALLAKTNTYGQELNSFDQLGTQEAQDYQRRYGNYVGAQEGMINEDDKVYNDSVRRFQDKTQIQGAINENNNNTWQSIVNLGTSLASMGMNGGFGGSSGGTNGGGWNPPRQGFNSSGRATGIFG